MATFQTIPEVIASYPDRFQPREAAGVDGVLQLDLTGEGGGAYYLVVRDQRLETKQGTHHAPTLTVKTSAEDWLRVNNGETTPLALVVQKRLELRGDLPMAAKFQSMFRPA